MDTLFFIASKLFWGIARPESLILILLAVSLVQLWRGRIRAASRVLSLTLITLILIAFFPVSHHVMRPLEARFPANPEVADPAGIVLLGGSERYDISVEWGQPTLNEAGERYVTAIALARKYPDIKVLFTGGSGALIRGGRSEARIAEQIFLDAGIAPERIILEGESRNTAENAAYALEMIGDPGERPWILVTSAFHMPRAIGVFCAAGWPNIVPYATDYRTATPRLELKLRFAENLETLNRATKEWIGLVAYWLTGRSESIFPAGCRQGAGAQSASSQATE